MSFLSRNNIKEISEKHNIPESTLYKWANNKSIINHLKYILFITEFVDPEDLKEFCIKKIESIQQKKEP